MLTAITATYENGQITWDEPPPTQKKARVVVTFLDEEVPASSLPRKRQGGSMKGEVWMADDFNEPLDGLSDYTT